MVLAASAEKLKRMPANSIPGGSPGMLYRICSEADALQDRLSLTQNRGFIPLRDLLARRLISKKDWDKLPESQKSNVRNIYQPAPAVWDNWVSIAKRINLRSEHEPEFISERWVNEIFENLSKTNVYNDQMLRATGEYGNCSCVCSALSADQIHELTSTGLLKFIRTKCLESATPYEQAMRQQKTLNCLSEPFDERASRTPDGKYCGMIVYPDASTSRRLLQSLIAETNTYWTELQKNPETIDPVYFAGYVQKRFITIHPFSDYNGRISRLIMDRILTKLGLPAPILDDMDADLTTPADAWGRQVGQGILNTLNGLHKCACNPSAPECQKILSPDELAPNLGARMLPAVNRVYPGAQFNPPAQAPFYFPQTPQFNFQPYM